MMDRDDALEYSKSLAQIGDGWWRQMVWAARQQIPEALGMSVEEWRKTYYGHLHLPPPERREAVAELASEGMSLREIGEALGVSHETVRTDLAPVKKLTPEAKRDGQEDQSTVKSLTPDVSPQVELNAGQVVPGQVALLDLIPDEPASQSDAVLDELVTTDDDRAKAAWRRAVDEVTTAQARIVEWHDRWTPEQRRELAAALVIARRDLDVEPAKLEVVR